MLFHPINTVGFSCTVRTMLLASGSLFKWSCCWTLEKPTDTSQMEAPWPRLSWYLGIVS